MCVCVRWWVNASDRKRQDWWKMYNQCDSLNIIHDIIHFVATSLQTTYRRCYTDLFDNDCLLRLYRLNYCRNYVISWVHMQTLKQKILCNFLCHTKQIRRRECEERTSRILFERTTLCVNVLLDTKRALEIYSFFRLLTLMYSFLDRQALTTNNERKIKWNWKDGTGRFKLDAFVSDFGFI